MAGYLQSASPPWGRWCWPSWPASTSRDRELKTRSRAVAPTRKGNASYDRRTARLGSGFGVVAISGSLILAAALALAIVRLPTPEIGDEYRSEAGAFSLRVPKGWVTTQHEPDAPSQNGIYLGSHEPLVFGRWRRAGIWVARCDRPVRCGAWDGRRVDSDYPGVLAQQASRVDGHDAIRNVFEYRPPELPGRAGLMIRVVEYYVLTEDHVYQFGYWSYPPYLAGQTVRDLSRTIEIH